MVCLRDPSTKQAQWFPPGGRIEANESPAETAQRETFEETGYVVRIFPESRVTDKYPFQWGGVLYECVTHYFFASLDQPFEPVGDIVDASYHEGVCWHPLTIVNELLAFNLSSQAVVMKILSRHYGIHEL